MQCIALIAVSFLFTEAKSQVFPVDSIMRNGNRSNRINFVYLADGYQSSQLPTFITNVGTINNALFSQTPFLQYKNFFNSFAVRVPSTDAGAKHPATASDESTSNGQPAANPTNYFQSTFDYGSIHRLLVPTNTSAVFNVLASNLPDYDQAFIVVNSPYYGGSGGTFATGSTDPSSTEVAIHEIGHSFAGLADEYWAGIGYAAEKPNMTANNNPATVKWKNWVGINSIGVYPYGSTSPLNSWYRPHQLCKMQYLGYPFCSVCTERLVDRIHQLVNMIDVASPAATSFTLTNRNPVNLSLTALQTTTSSITTNWYLNGSASPFATNQSSVSIPYSSLIIGTNTVRAEVVDNTTLSKSFSPAAGYVNNLTWTISNPNVLPVRLKSFTGRVSNSSILNWEIASTDDLKNFEVEKSYDGTNFSTFAAVEGIEQKNAYQLNDPELPKPLSYYRLKVNEKSGAFFYSAVIRLQNDFSKFSYKVYQQSEDRSYHVAVRLDNGERVKILVADANGRQVLTKDFGMVPSALDYDFSLSDKPAGVYFVTINIDNKQYTVQVLAK